MLYLTESYRGQSMHGVVDKKAMASVITASPAMIHSPRE